ncbi:TetR/AcrR family transcriptional regulator [Scleromatobacter humisilvae]|uniref:TetR/AcrR family transcriptional regulator n=1 Tax=Scleromatobacter humisilvae TaxID=2897159 RepID=A0A9X1YFH9_9BURK|nr:TetR/AcrR family transcriptional regulator [Scleromatobacter humisilvae]MCK9685424.1 TetR/AcrR family transcriptional regulator [Scleromatobacter humisilvae]
MTNPPESLSSPARSTAGEAGRQPRQERSRHRVETILDVALALVVEQGAEALAMREVARRADVQISSIYQYFPSKAHIIRELAKRNLARVRLLLQDEVRRLLAEFDDAPPVAESVERLVDAYFAHYRDQPDALAVWAGAQSDHGLRELDLEDTRSTAEFLVMPLQRILGRDDRETVYPLALLVSEVTGAAARLALALESPLREQLIARHKAMLVATLEAHRT